MPTNNQQSKPSSSTSSSSSIDIIKTKNAKEYLKHTFKFLRDRMDLSSNTRYSKKTLFNMYRKWIFDYVAVQGLHTGSVEEECNKMLRGVILPCMAGFNHYGAQNLEDFKSIILMPYTKHVLVSGDYTKKHINKLFKDITAIELLKLFPALIRDIEASIESNIGANDSVFVPIIPHYFHHGGGKSNLKGSHDHNIYHVEQTVFLHPGRYKNKFIPYLTNMNGDWYKKPDSTFIL